MLADIVIRVNLEWKGNVISTLNVQPANLGIGVFFLACHENNTMFFDFRQQDEEVTERARLPTMKKVRMKERNNTCENSNI